MTANEVKNSKFGAHAAAIGATKEPNQVIFKKKLGATLDYIFTVALIKNTKCNLKEKLDIDPYMSSMPRRRVLICRHVNYGMD